ncbi:MAG: succinate dehydrogenase, hydrophobic membrane anchor protein [Burkholderiaceae bacterium]
MTTSRTVVGAHYGLKDWLAQRISGVVLAAYALILFFVWAGSGPLDFHAWRAIFAGSWMKVLTLLAVLALIWHAWIGVRDIYMDYIKPTGLRLSLQVATIVVLLGYAVWAATILWRF